MRHLAEELTAGGHPVSAETVGKVLWANGFSLQGNAKQFEGGDHPDRDGQFSYLNEQAAAHASDGQPVISVDTKKKQLVGDYKNGGREWRPTGDPQQVKVYDFLDPALGKANPYGVYDVSTDTGWIAVGTDHDTSAFAVNTIRSWWNAIGKDTYPGATRLLISADGGGSNGYRTRAWKTDWPTWPPRTGLAITLSTSPGDRALNRSSAASSRTSR